MIVICETDYYKNVGVLQHFFLYDPLTKERIDPLDLKPDWEANTYPIVSYRVLELPLQAPTPPESTPEPQQPTEPVKPPETQPVAPETTPVSDIQEIHNQTGEFWQKATNFLISLIKWIRSKIYGTP
jgi:hypothetical protein